MTTVRATLALWLLLASASLSLAQLGGEATYSFLNLPLTPRTAAVGGKLVALDESDLSIGFNNPSQLNADLHNHFDLSYVSYYSGIQYGYLSYARHVDQLGTFAAGMHHVAYGSFPRTDELGNLLGSFTSYDMAMYLSYARQIDSLFSVGISLKPIYSRMESYRSLGLALDLGASYRSRSGYFSGGLVFRNLGSMLMPYSPGTWEQLPFQIVAGISQRLKHAPFRFILTFHQLQYLSLYHHRQPEGTIILGGQRTERSLLERIGTEAISHVIVGFEFLPIPGFTFRVGYNYQRRNELKIDQRPSTVGLSWGVGIQLRRFHFSYGRATYHLVGGTNHFSITSNLQNFFSKGIL